jgi:ADP-ribose pyrophosphatase YjhB (NUDIX family)
MPAWSGHSVGVGGIVVNEQGQVLLVRQNYGASKDKWILPGGYVERDELLTDAVRREVREETGIEAEVVGIVGVRHRIDNPNVYMIFLLRHVSGAPMADGHEVTEARFWNVEDIQDSENVIALSQLAASRLGVNQVESSVLKEMHVPGRSGAEFVYWGW